MGRVFLMCCLISLCHIYHINSSCPSKIKLQLLQPSNRSLTCGKEDIVLAEADNSDGMQHMQFQISATPADCVACRYTLVIVDPDAPGLERNQFYLHMIVANLMGNDLKAGISTGDIQKGTVITGYAYPTPPGGTGFHRYEFMLYKQNTLEEMDVKPVIMRSGFNLEEFIKDRNLGSCSASCVIRVMFGG
ncbi:phosphatidylethanolamine-binding protein 4-like [Tubulanus polymorphus]|uniref:phosphatidylethanolamine-binding protein 4-like n=1 Tax=Tubulanus polymorphus TaxID=672921 RepID=UPI003DA261D9